MSDRFPPEIAELLAAEGWSAERRDDGRARDWALRVAGYADLDGRHHVVVPAAVEAYAEFGGLRLRPNSDGEQIAPSSVHLDPFRVLHSVTTLTAFADALGSPVTPLGEEGDGTGILAIDEAGRVFVLDHGGDWFLGDTLDAALGTLLLGRQPARVRLDGTW